MLCGAHPHRRPVFLEAAFGRPPAQARFVNANPAMVAGSQLASPVAECGCVPSLGNPHYPPYAYPHANFLTGPGLKSYGMEGKADGWQVAGPFNQDSTLSERYQALKNTKPRKITNHPKMPCRHVGPDGKRVFGLPHVGGYRSVPCT